MKIGNSQPTQLQSKPSAAREAPYAVFDLDGTLSKGFISIGFLDYVHEHDLYDDSDYKHQQEILTNYKNGSLSYDEWVKDWGKTWAHGLKGKHETDVKQAASDFFNSYRNNLYPEAPELVSELKAHGYRNVMISAGVFEVVDQARAALGLDATLATKAHVEQGLYTGELETKLHTSTGKAEALEQIAATQGVPTFAFGDSSGDIGMLSLAKVPVCLNPNADLSNEASKRGWAKMPIAEAPSFLRQQLDQDWNISQ